MRTQVGIVGAGPAGLMLSHLLHLAGLRSVVIEARSRQYVRDRIRAGVIEQPVADLLDNAGLGARMRRDGLRHEGTQLLFGGRLHRIDLHALTGAAVTVYGQHEVVRDLIDAREAANGELVFDAAAVRVDGFDTGDPAIHYAKDGRAHTLRCDVIAGCDGFHGICRPSVPAGALRTVERTYPFGWLGILAEVPPSSAELVYANHARGFALLSMRSPTVGRFYLQCEPNEDPGTWSDDRLWSELSVRLAHPGFALATGRIFQKGVTPMRSFVAAPMRHGRLFLLGDAAHIVPPTGAKGMNSALADVAVLARALERWYAAGDAAGLDGFSDACLRRVWKVQRFSAWMTGLLHRFPDQSAFDREVQLAELDYLATSRAAATALAENYVGLPIG